MNKKIKLKKLAQYGEYRYEPLCDCPDHQAYRFEDRKKFNIDGYADTRAGLMLCCTCRECGYKFMFHLRLRGGMPPSGDIFDNSGVQDTLNGLTLWGCTIS